MNQRSKTDCRMNRGELLQNSLDLMSLLINMSRILTQKYILQGVILLQMQILSSTAGWIPLITSLMLLLNGRGLMASFFLNNSRKNFGNTNFPLGGNWMYFENGVRDFVTDRKLDLVVYTGTHGVCELADIDGNMVDIYLYSPDKLPVPRYYWKILYDPISDAGIAVVGINNIHITVCEHFYISFHLKLIIIIISRTFHQSTFSVLLSMTTQYWTMFITQKI